MKLKVGMPLVTKDGNKYSNAVVFDIKEGEHRNVVTVVTDFNNKLVFPFEEDVLVHWDVSESYKEYAQIAEEFGMQDAMDSVFSLRERFERQLELLNNIMEELNNGNKS